MNDFFGVCFMNFACNEQRCLHRAVEILQYQNYLSTNIVYMMYLIWTQALSPMVYMVYLTWV